MKTFFERLMAAKLAVIPEAHERKWPHEVFEEFTRFLNQKHKGEFVAQFSSQDVSHGSISLSEWTRPNSSSTILHFFIRDDGSVRCDDHTIANRKELEQHLWKFYKSLAFARFLKQLTENDRKTAIGYLRPQEDMRTRSCDVDVAVKIEYESVRMVADAYRSGSEGNFEVKFKISGRTPLAEGEDVSVAKWLIVSGMRFKVETVSDESVTGYVPRE